MAFLRVPVPDTPNLAGTTFAQDDQRSSRIGAAILRQQGQVSGREIGVQT